MGETAADLVAEAFRQTPRRAFLPKRQRRHADLDQPLPLSGGQTNSQPSTVASMLRLLDVRQGHRVLDVGSGSGWTTALLAYLVGPTGSVLGVELDADLVAWGAGNLASTQRDWARIEAATPERLGRPEQGPYDRILVSAMARTLPAPLVAQLVPEGIMVIPVAGRMLRVTRLTAAMGDLQTRVEHFGAYRFVPLR